MATEPIQVAARAAADWVDKNDPELDPTCGDNGYPTEIELTRIRTWGDRKENDLNDSMRRLMLYIKDRWQYAGWGWAEVEDRDGTVFYTISTGGWSGNEDLMGALRESFLFWGLLFESMRAGGHYILRRRQLKSG